jgi:tetratricopeptide (TPR) repeat protein
MATRVTSEVPFVTLLGLLFHGAPAQVQTRQDPDPAALRQLAEDGERALAQGRYAEAQEAYEALRRRAPETGEVHARLGLIYFQQGRFADAIPPLREALRLKPDLRNAEPLLAMSLSELGRYEEALPTLTKAFSQTADVVVRRLVGLHLQRIYTGLRRDREAVEVALQLCRLYPDNPEVLYHSGRLFANFAYLQTMRLADVAPDSVWLHQAAGEANESLGLHDAALSEYRQVLSAAPRRPGVHPRIGRVLLARAVSDGSNGDAVEARREFEAALALDPTNANAAYELAELERKAGEPERARALFAQAVAHHPSFETALVGLARTLLALDRPEEALPLLRTALAQNPASEVAYYLLTRARRALGDAAGQRRHLPRFVECVPALPVGPRWSRRRSRMSHPTCSKLASHPHDSSPPTTAVVGVETR